MFLYWNERPAKYTTYNSPRTVFVKRLDLIGRLPYHIRAMLNKMHLSSRGARRLPKNSFDSTKRLVRARSNIRSHKGVRSIYDIINDDNMGFWQKVNYIRHVYTNYDRVYRVIDTSTRNALNDIIAEIVKGTITPDALKEANKVLDDVAAANAPKTNPEDILAGLEPDVRRLSANIAATKEAKLLKAFHQTHGGWDRPQYISTELLLAAAEAWENNKRKNPPFLFARRKTLDKFLDYYGHLATEDAERFPMPIPSLDCYLAAYRAYPGTSVESQAAKIKGQVALLRGYQSYIRKQEKADASSEP